MTVNIQGVILGTSYAIDATQAFLFRYDPNSGIQITYVYFGQGNHIQTFSLLDSQNVFAVGYPDPSDHVIMLKAE